MTKNRLVTKFFTDEYFLAAKFSTDEIPTDKVFNIFVFVPLSGSWSSGLREDADVKTGVDTTANGPLFQQRPYPSPGDILRRNRQPKNNEDDDEE